MRFLAVALFLVGCTEQPAAAPASVPQPPAVTEPRGGEKAPFVRSTWVGTATVRVGGWSQKTGVRIELTPPWAGEKNDVHFELSVGDEDKLGGCFIQSRIGAALEGPGDDLALTLDGGRLTARMLTTALVRVRPGVDGELDKATTLLVRFGARELHGRLAGTARYGDSSSVEYEVRFTANLDGVDPVRPRPAFVGKYVSRIVGKQERRATVLLAEGRWQFRPDGTFVFQRAGLTVEGTHRSSMRQTTLSGQGTSGYRLIVLRGSCEAIPAVVDLWVTILTAKHGFCLEVERVIVTLRPASD